MSQMVTSTTHHLPSGATDGAPTRLTFQRSSGVIGQGAARAGVTQRRRRPTRNMGKVPRLRWSARDEHRELTNRAVRIEPILTRFCLQTLGRVKASRQAVTILPESAGCALREGGP